MAKIGYARVSTRSQKDDSQIDELTGYGCDKIFTDKASGKLADRPELDKARDALTEQVLRQDQVRSALVAAPRPARSAPAWQVPR